MAWAAQLCYSVRTTSTGVFRAGTKGKRSLHQWRIEAWETRETVRPQGWPSLGCHRLPPVTLRPLSCAEARRRCVKGDKEPLLTGMAGNCCSPAKTSVLAWFMQSSAAAKDKSTAPMIGVHVGSVTDLASLWIESNNGSQTSTSTSTTAFFIDQKKCKAHTSTSTFRL